MFVMPRVLTLLLSPLPSALLQVDFKPEQGRRTLIHVSSDRISTFIISDMINILVARNFSRMVKKQKPSIGDGCFSNCLMKIFVSVYEII